MSKHKIAPEVRALLREQLDSSEKLELVHALRTAGQPLSPRELATRCRLPPATVREALGCLTQHAILEALEGGTRFRVSPAIRSSVEALMAAYEDDRSIVLAALNELTFGKIRGLTVEAFAEALVVRRRGKPGG